MTANTSIKWTREEDERWAAAFERELVLKHNPQKGLADQALSEVHETVTETGRSARDLFDDPRQYAASVAAERIDEAHTSRVDLAGTTAGERFTAGLAVAGFNGVLLSASLWVRNGIRADVSWATLTGVGALAAATVVACVALALRTAGRMAAMRACLGAFAVTLVGGIAAASLLPHHALFSLPAPVLLAASAAVMVGAHRLPDRTADRWFAPARGGGSEAWLRRLDGLLRGRHGMSAADARGHVAEARSHLAAAPEPTAQGEFGDVEIYASRLADGPGRKRRAQRRRVLAVGLLAVLVVVAWSHALRSQGVASYRFWVPLVLLAACAADIVQVWRDGRRQKR
ncbi:hypothetical protein [Streptomyces sp. NBC_01481]|uniref:hypothetical protein n=1 Tax=Streptomyces sp. NBC_01481 TaxID=2975869 RepID=UPI00224C9119|nr:hypothetical protein [Streptomyces sp. NBC_01481]MCX4584567.1 hypothetical protein [Streptomyces sp. NBC_01481]